MAITTKFHIYSSFVLSLVIFPATGLANNNGVRYYLSLGTSLAVGVQPDASGANQLTDEGYPDQLFGLIRDDFRKIRMVKLGCAGETTVTMINGGICTYPKRSQLNEAIRFLHAHKDKVELVTIDIGVNDLLVSGCIDGSDIDEACLIGAIGQVAEKLTFILTALRAAAHPDTRIIGMNYYNTFLAAWLDPTAGGPPLAFRSALLAGFFNGTLEMVYGGFGIPTADVAGAYMSNNFTDMVSVPGGSIPINVALICQWTYMCLPPPVGPDIHANPEGYGVIALAFFGKYVAPGGT